MNESYKLKSTETTPEELNKTLEELQSYGCKISQIIPYASNIYGGTFEWDDQSNADFQTTIKLIVLYLEEEDEENTEEISYGY